jgi:hypothetical protein
MKRHSVRSPIPGLVQRRCSEGARPPSGKRGALIRIIGSSARLVSILARAHPRFGRCASGWPKIGFFPHLTQEVPARESLPPSRGVALSWPEYVSTLASLELCGGPHLLNQVTILCLRQRDIDQVAQAEVELCRWE